MREGRKVFFSEEKKQKTFNFSPAARSRPRPRSWKLRKEQKSFGSFLQKRTTYFLFAFFTFPAFAQDVFRQPGTPPPEPPAEPIPSGIVPADPDLAYTQIPVPDRNRIIDALGTPDNPFDPYHQSTLKGDRPIFDDWFVELSAVSDTVYEPRAVPVPVNVIDTYNTQNNDQFGRPKQTFFSQTVIPSIAIIKGDTTFQPPEFQLRITPAFTYTQLDVGELGLVNIDPTRGTTRNSTFVGLQEAFIDYHLRDVSARYDFDAIRIGIQPINADFRGFLFQDQQLGVRLFGDRLDNRVQYNLAYFRRIEKDTNSGLNDLGQPLRRDDIFMANLFIQDLPVKGYTAEFSLIQNDNHETATNYDKNGFQVRPAEIGLDNPHKYDVTYFGLNGDGHIGRLNLTQSAYYALGNDKESEFSGVGARIKAYFAALEPSIDIDWLRIRGSALYASGSGNPYGRTETGFDAILENPQFAGADTSYWIRQGIPLIGGGGVDLVGPNGVLPDLRSSKDEGQSNFINPGVLLLGIGADADVLPQLRFSLNFNHLSFNDTQVLEVLRAQSPIHRDIGWDISGAVTWRPFDTQNVIFRASAAVLIPGQGFKDLFASEGSDQVYYSVLVNAILKY
jgi:hypothetical protein